jgi:regulator of sirC expression with transglutaminase-like and TPR domain
VITGASSDILQAFAGLVRSEIDDERVDLLRSALTFARIEDPQLDIEHYVRRVDELAARVAEKIRNSFLHDVLDRRLGIPITLALVYMEVARRIGFQLFGVGMPGHFLLKHYDVDGRAILIDAFERGSIVTEDDCRQKLDIIYSGQLALQPEFLLPVTRRQMLTRMLNNLRSVYLTQRDFRRAVQVVDLILVIYPRSPEDMKQRAVLRYNLNDYRGALSDFDEYGKMSPDASDAEEIKQTALSLRRSMAMMN